jgi:N-acetylglutamate synthase-like GNAT family acetyltransferase
MQRTEAAWPAARPSTDLTRIWQARRWYYTPGSGRPYSVRQASAGDRRLLAAFALDLTRSAHDRELEALQELTRTLFDRVLTTAGHEAAGFVALENTGEGDRVIGVSAYVRAPEADGEFCVAVAEGFRGEQVGRTLLSSLVRHARHVGVPQLTGEMLWSNRAMQMLATSLGFSVEASARDRSRRRLMLALK